jgi:mannosyltransferase
VGAVLRLVALGHKSFWIDEIASVVIAQKPSAAFWHFLWHDEGNMALYYMLLRPWLHFGNSEAVVRLLSVLPGVLAIPLMYLLGKRLFGPGTGMLAAALFALNPCAIGSSQEARAYSFLVLSVVASTYCFVRLIEVPGYRFAIAYGIVAGVTCYFHYFGVLVPAAHAISLMVMPRGRRPWKQYAIAGVVFALFAIPILWLIHAQDIGHLSWVQPPSLLEFYHLGVFLAADGGKAVGAVLLAFDLLLVGFFLASIKAVWTERNDLQRWRHSLVASSFFSPIVIVLIVSIVRPAFYHRFLIICMPSFVMMTALGALRIRHRLLRISAVACVCILSLVATVILYTRVTEDWRGAVSYLIAESHPEDRVLYYQSLGAFAAENYWNWLPGGSAPRPKEVDVGPPSTDWRQEIGDASRVWLVLYRAKAHDPESRAIEQELLKRYDAGGEKVFRGVSVIEYEVKH